MARHNEWLELFKNQLFPSASRNNRQDTRQDRRVKFRKLIHESLEDRKLLAFAVGSFAPTPSGFTAELTAPIKLDNLNLYDSASGGMGAADVILQGETVGNVRGSLVVEGNRITFVSSAGVLVPDTYFATLRSASDAFVDAALGQLLDGEFNGQFPSGNGVPGGDFVTSFVVAALPTVVVGMPDFARGPSQPVNVPAVGSGQSPLPDLPIQFSNTAGITSLTMTVSYDPSLLNVTDVNLGPSAPNGSQVEANLTNPGEIVIAFFSLEPLAAGAGSLIVLESSVPDNATYGSAHLIRISSLEINSGAIEAATRDAVHLVAFPGDVTGNRRYDAEDARLVARVGVGLDSGFVGALSEGVGTPQMRPFATIDPIIIGDVTGLEGISPLDASDILRRVVGLPTPNIPALPTAQAPTGIALSSTIVGANLPSGTVVGTLSTADPDLGDTHTYSIVSGDGDTNNNLFAISGNALVTTAALNATGQQPLSVRVQTTDSTGRSFQRFFLITVNEDNQAPTSIQLNNQTVAENSASGTVVGLFSTIDPNAGDTHTYTLVAGEGDAANDWFTIDGNQLLTAESFDFETTPEVSIRVRSTDAGGLFVEQTFVIAILDINEAPTMVALDNTIVDVDSPVDTLVGNFSTTDPDAGDTHTYTLVVGEGDTDNEMFSIAGSQLLVAAELPNQESFSIRVRSTDAGGLFVEQVIVLTGTDLNVGPTSIELSNTSINENEPAGTLVGLLSSMDPNAGDTHTYTLVAGEGDAANDWFTIDGNQLLTAESFDFETTPEVSIRVRSTDAGGLFVEQTFVIAILDINEAPTMVALDNTIVDVDSPVDTLVGNFSTTDPDAGDTHTYTLVVGEGDTDNEMFSIAGSQLLVAAELPNQESFSIRVRSTDAGGLFVEHVMVLSATETNQAPTSIELGNTSINENEPAGTLVGLLSSMDPNAGDTHTYTLVAGEGDAANDWFTIEGNQLLTAESFDFETTPEVSVRVRSTDAGGLFVEQTFVITILDVNEAPTMVALDNTIVDVDSPVDTLVGNFSTTDPDAGDTHTYTLVVGEGDTDNEMFSIAGNQLLVAAELPNQESFSIRVRSTDAGGLFVEQVIVLSATESNQAPTAIELSNTSINENEPAGTLVGLLSSLDPNAGDTHTYTLVAGEGDTANDWFTIEGNQLLTAESFDFETTPEVSIRVRSTDAGGLFVEQTFVIAILDVNEAPTGIQIDNVFVFTLAPAGTLVGILSTDDPDSGDSHSYELVAGEGDMDNILFEIDGNQLLVLGEIDFANQESFSVRVRSTDADGLSVEQVFVILEAPF
ncbi:cohesin domain-containing protein [Pirellulaceae bacterium SH449]